MASARISGVRLTGLAAAVPSSVRGVEDLAGWMGEADAAKVAKETGVRERRVAPSRTCTSDLCQAAARALLAAAPPKTVDVLVFVSQTPDYFLPATSALLQHRLGLARGCAAFDVNLGCSGYVYGLWIAASIVAAGGARVALVLSGDTITRFLDAGDRSTVPLFGDAGTATLLEADATAAPMVFHLSTDGAGGNHLVVPGGAFRHGFGAPADDGAKTPSTLHMNGPEIFAFTLREVPPLVGDTLDLAGWGAEEPDAFVCHQANRFILEFLRRKIGIAADRFVIGLERYGNTSSASIPLAMVTELGDRLRGQRLKLLLAGFGVGLSWGGAAVEAGPLVVPPLMEIDAA